MAKKFYVVWAGHKPGIYTTWDEAKQQVDKFSGARYKSFATQAEAKAAFGQSASKSLGKPTAGSSKTSSAKAGSKASSPQALKLSQQAALAKFDVVIYTDGGCEPNPGKAGSGMAVYRKAELSSLWYGLYNPNGTNNTAELNALFEALKLAQTELENDSSVCIFSDSQYSINCICNWAYGWKAKGWTRKGGEIANLELIKQAHELYDAIKDKLVVEHVAAHVGIEGNELADRMSIYAVDQQQKAFAEYSQPIDLKSILALRAG